MVYLWLRRCLFKIEGWLQKVAKWLVVGKAIATPHAVVYLRFSEVILALSTERNLQSSDSVSAVIGVYWQAFSANSILVAL